MDEHSTSAFVNAIREEIRLIKTKELAYRAIRHRTFEQLTAHTRRELRLLEIRALLQRMQESRKEKNM